MFSIAVLLHSPVNIHQGIFQFGSWPLAVFGLQLPNGWMKVLAIIVCLDFKYIVICKSLIYVKPYSLILRRLCDSFQ